MDPHRSTNEIRLIAQDVTKQQERLCQARQSNLDEKLSTLAETTQANSSAISELTKTVAVLAATVEPLPVAIKESEKERDILKDSVTKLKGRPAIWAAIGSALPVLGGLLWLWANN